MSGGGGDWRWAWRLTFHLSSHFMEWPWSLHMWLACRRRFSRCILEHDPDLVVSLHPLTQALPIEALERVQARFEASERFHAIYPSLTQSLLNQMQGLPHGPPHSVLGSWYPGQYVPELGRVVDGISGDVTVGPLPPPGPEQPHPSVAAAAEKAKRAERKARREAAFREAAALEAAAGS